MAYEIAYKNSVTRDLKRLSKADARRILDQIEADLSRKPDRHPALSGSFAGLRRMRVGDFRIIFAIMDSTVLVLQIGHRRDVYTTAIES
ncbi:MAG: type II toxin-antitoxin system RelE/ParE family toxin [Ignavibacteria bacterium]|nr:type II toxin-antitoxin system RelE/ParE family toxin [Ignavibacteria bacterium]